MAKFVKNEIEKRFFKKVEMDNYQSVQQDSRGSQDRDGRRVIAPEDRFSEIPETPTDIYDDKKTNQTSYSTLKSGEEKDTSPRDRFRR